MSTQKRKTRPLIDRFWEKVVKGDGCWIWIGARVSRKENYGKIARDRQNGLQYAHRIAWELHHGPIPTGLRVLHRCDNPPCVNPEHLFLGTLSDNTRDAVSKRRHFLPHGGYK